MKNSSNSAGNSADVAPTLDSRKAVATRIAALRAAPGGDWRLESAVTRLVYAMQAKTCRHQLDWARMALEILEERFVRRLAGC